jgi:Fe2+ or Zn2+ uptake regulation protein
MINKFVEFGRFKLREEGYRVTDSRVCVLSVLDKSKKPLGAYQIAEKSKIFEKEIDVVTVYRILKLFEKLSLIHKIGRGYVACKKFECQNQDHCHHQFICEKCSSVKEIHLEEEKFFKTLSLQFPNLTVNSHHFEFFGVCGDCNK